MDQQMADRFLLSDPHLQDIFDDSLFIVVASLQILHIEFEQVQRSGT